MPAVDQMLRAWARTHGNPPFWVVEKDCFPVYRADVKSAFPRQVEKAFAFAAHRPYPFARRR